MATKRTTQTSRKRANQPASQTVLPATKVCVGPCSESLPLKKFGTHRTKAGAYERDDECRACRDARRAEARRT